MYDIIILVIMERTLLSSEGSDSMIDDNQTPVSDEIIAVNHESTEEID